MLKIKSEILKITKKVKIIKLKKFPAKFYREFPESRETRKSPEIPEKLLENFPFPG